MWSAYLPLSSLSEELAVCSSFHCNTFIAPTAFPRRFLMSQLSPRDVNAMERFVKVSATRGCSGMSGFLQDSPRSNEVGMREGGAARLQVQPTTTPPRLPYGHLLKPRTHHRGKQVVMRHGAAVRNFLHRGLRLCISLFSSISLFFP